MTTSELNSTRNPDNTSTPQSAGSSSGANDGSHFQQSADAGVLNQNKPVTVISTGRPISGSGEGVTTSGGGALWLIFVLVVLLLVIGSYNRMKKKSQHVAIVKQDVKKLTVAAKPKKKVRNKSKRRK